LRAAGGDAGAAHRRTLLGDHASSRDERAASTAEDVPLLPFAERQHGQQGRRRVDLLAMPRVWGDLEPEPPSWWAVAPGVALVKGISPEAFDGH
jgi:hypothetical protein